MRERRGKPKESYLKDQYKKNDKEIRKKDIKRTRFPYFNTNKEEKKDTQLNGWTRKKDPIRKYGRIVRKKDKNDSAVL